MIIISFFVSLYCLFITYMNCENEDTIIKILGKSCSIKKILIDI